MKRIIPFMLLLVLTALQLQAQEIPQVTNVLNRQATMLNGDWHYIVDVQEEGYYDYRMNPINWGFMLNAKAKRPEDLIEYDFDAAPTMKVPGDWNTQDERLFFYEGTVWLQRYFDYTPQGDRRALLYFGAVNYDCHVYVNGKKAGHHVGGFTPFNFDVTDLLHEGKNFVIVKVDNKRSASAVPTQIFDWWNYGGITRDVMLLSVAPTYIEDYSVKLDALPNVKDKKVVIDFSLKLNRPVAGESVTITFPELKIRWTLTTDENGCLQTKLSTKKSKVELWTPEHPRLYKMLLEYGDETLTDEIGLDPWQTDSAQRQSYISERYLHA